MDSGIECTLSTFADNTKLCDVVNMLERRDAIQRDLGRLESGLKKQTESRSLHIFSNDFQKEDILLEHLNACQTSQQLFVLTSFTKFGIVKELDEDQHLGLFEFL
ncbi:cAMP-dependent protein kinase inhibitor alpha [Grus japonensis]|uniref:cAMP-dependent protein kinase inhibitor alpha n=1 Tax=Grus japonensis TaxID=30415 RepID=A0ABC9VRA7_GRUJA